MDKKLVFVTRHYKKGWLSIDYFLFDTHRFILININRNICQKSWEHILRTFILQASCASPHQTPFALSLAAHKIDNLPIPNLFIRAQQTRKADAHSHFIICGGTRSGPNIPAVDLLGGG